MRLKGFWVVLSLLVWSGGCVRAGYRVGAADGGVSSRDGDANGDMRVHDGLDAGVSDSPVGMDLPWGTYAASLNVPPCPPAPELVVDTTTGELEGGETIADRSAAGAKLSLVEAFWIASNRSGPDTIRFDAKVFPVEQPGRILLSEDNRLPLNAKQVCIDGRDRGVIIDWEPVAYGCAACIWNLTEGSLQVGLTLLNMPFELMLSGGSQVAGSRLNTDGLKYFPCDRFWTLEVSETTKVSTIGPGNVITGREGLRVFGGQAHVEGNHFGYDPLTRRQIDLQGAFDLRGGQITIVDNVFDTKSMSFDTNSDAMTVTLKDNRFGVDRQGRPLPGGEVGITRLTKGTFVIGPGNVITGVSQAVEIAGAKVKLTRNSIYNNDVGISYMGATSPVPAPTINKVSTSSASGTCQVAGLVELFSDVEDQGESFVAETSCDPQQGWSVSAALPTGRNVTATLTTSGGQTSSFSDPLPVK